MKTKHAVLEDAGIVTRLVFIDESTRNLQAEYIGAPVKHISELWEFAQVHGITHFWCMPGSEPDKIGYDFFSERGGYNIFVPLMNPSEGERPEFPRGGRCWKEEGKGFQIFVFFPRREPWSWPVATHLEVLATIDYLNKVIGADIQWSPQAIGGALLQAQYSKTLRLKSYLKKPTVDLKELPFKRADRDVQWCARLSHELVGQTLHLYDKNSAHPSGAAMMVTGVGNPVHIDGAVEPKKPGIYRVTWNTGISQFDGAFLPTIFSNGQEWTTLPVLKYATQKGYQVQVHEAYVFEENHRLFDSWVHDLWQARQALTNVNAFPFEPGREIARDTVKDIMNKTISSLRVSWWADMVGTSRVALLANLAVLASKGSYPILVYHDAVGFVARDTNPYTAVPGILVKQNQLGGYKHVYSMTVTQDILNQCLQVHEADAMIKIFHREARAVGVH